MFRLLPFYSHLGPGVALGPPPRDQSFVRFSTCDLPTIRLYKIGIQVKHLLVRNHKEVDFKVMIWYAISFYHSLKAKANLYTEMDELVYFCIRD